MENHEPIPSLRHLQNGLHHAYLKPVLGRTTSLWASKDNEASGKEHDYYAGMSAYQILECSRRSVWIQCFLIESVYCINIGSQGR